MTATFFVAAKEVRKVGFASRDRLGGPARPKEAGEIVDFRTADGFVSLFQIGRENVFDPFHEGADSARQVTPMRDYQGDDERLVLKIG